MNRIFLHLRAWALALVLSISAIAFGDNSYGLKDNIQDGVILHCFDWTAAQIEAEIPTIAKAGFTAVQLSPVHQKEGASSWYMAYQPYDFHIGNSIATTESLTSLCTKAHEYGVKVIVDVVANHTNGSLDYVADYLKDTNLYHDYSGGINYGDRWQVTHGKIGMWDLKTEDATVQGIIKAYVAELKACGVDGIRWDAAKHIGLPSENDTFWANVPDAEMYNYGEILDAAYSGDDGTLLKEYAKYICFTDNGYGDGLASSFNSGYVPSSIGNFNQNGVDDSRLVYWGESHDTYSNDGGSSKYISQNNIDKAYAIAAGNNSATSLYFSRPSATAKDDIKMGTKGSTHYTSPEVAEVNHMHNLCAGEANYYVHQNGIAAQLRKTGAIFVLGSGQSGTVSIPNGSGSWLTTGTYTDKVGGGTFKVTSTTITGQISTAGIAVVYGEPTQEETTTTTVKVYLKNDANWSAPIYCYAYNEDATIKTGNWPGAQMTLDEATGCYTIDLSTYGLSDAYCIFYSASGRYPADGAQGLATGGTSKVYNNSTCSWSDYTDTAFEMVATCNGETVVLPMTAMRTRESGPLATTYFARGFKDEQLPGNMGDEVKVYVRGKNNKTAVFRPTDSTMGTSYSLLSNTNLTDFRCDAYLSLATAGSSDNAITITKGAGVSYTIGLNLGEARNATYVSTEAHPISYTIKANSLSLYTNKSLDDLYGELSMTSGSYKNKDITSTTKKADLEDYYIFGSIYGTTSDDATKGGYMSSASGNWSSTDSESKTISDYFKMEKQLFLNPNDKEKVDSIVYSKVIKKPTNGYDNMYMTFAPQSLISATGGAWGAYGKSYTATEKWNYVVRPEVFDQQDGTALIGSTIVAGVEENKRRNGEQSLNTIVDNSKDYFIIRLNTTTSTYRVEFINSDKVSVNKYGIRTFCSRFNYAIPDGFAAYAAQSFTTSDNTTLNGQPQGTVNLRRLKFIPANEPVVLVYNKNFSNPFDGSNNAIAQEFTVITDGAGDPNKYLELEKNEDWWSNTTYTDTYNNLLVACLDDVTIQNGKYHKENGKIHYDYRNFALNLFHNTEYYKANNTGDDYVGFFRMDGKVNAGYAYLRLTDKEMNYNGQLLGDVNSGMDSKLSSPAKFTFAFDVEPWEDVTAIKKVAVSDSHNNDDAYYNLQGAKVTTPAKGVYIHKGKKVIMK